MPCARSRGQPLIANTLCSTLHPDLEITNTNNYNNNISNLNVNETDLHSDILQAPDSSDSNSSDTNASAINPTPIKFLTSDKANKADVEIDCIQQYLLSRRASPDLLADALTHFISRAHHFLIMGGQLWQ